MKSKVSSFLSLTLILLLAGCSTLPQNNFKGQLFINPRFESAQPFSEGLAAVQINKKWGYINSTDKFQINPKYSEAGLFRAGKALVATYPKNFTNPYKKVKDKYIFVGQYFLIDRKGNVVKEFAKGQEFYANYSSNLSDPLTLSMRLPNGNCIYLSDRGLVLSKTEFTFCDPFNEGLAGAGDLKSGLAGFIDRKGDWAIDPIFESVDSFSEGLAPADMYVPNGMPASRYGYIDRKGKWEINPQYWLTLPFSEGFGEVINEGSESDSYGLHGFVDKSGKMVIPQDFPTKHSSKYVDDGNFSSGYTVVESDSGVAFMDRKLQILNRWFDSVGQFNEGYAPVEVNGKWGFIDTKGEYVVQPQFDDVGAVWEGYAAVKIGNLWGYLK